jgi:uncharacterized protein YybS (DUF2232 family)
VAIATLAGYFGSVVMVLFAFTMEPLLAILGLSFLTIQVISAKLYNLVLLNIISIVGFVTTILGS